MKKFSILLLVAISFLACNKEENKTTKINTETGEKGEVWAEVISAQSPCVLQDGWSEEEWKKENKIDKEKIFNTITNAVLEGKLKAYNYIDNSVIEKDEFQNMLST